MSQSSDHLELGSLVRIQMKPIAVWWSGSAGLQHLRFIYRFIYLCHHNLMMAWYILGFIRLRQHKGSLWYWLSLILTSGGKIRPQSSSIILCRLRCCCARSSANKQEALYPGHLWFPTDGWIPGKGHLFLTFQTSSVYPVTAWTFLSQ